MEKVQLLHIQGQIGYNFKNIDLLEQAFTRRSYTQENDGEHNEVLEFIGDKILDIMVIQILTEKFGHFTNVHKDPLSFTKMIYDGNFVSDYDEGKLSEMKTRLVNKQTLAERTETLGFASYLKMSHGDEEKKIYEQKSVKEDLFEAIIGAVALDSNWNFEILRDVVEIMLCPDNYLTNDNNNYVQLIQDWSLTFSTGVPFFQYIKSGYLSRLYQFNGISQIIYNVDDPQINEIKYHCLIKIRDDIPDFRGFGKSQNEARRAVCEVAYKYLKKNNLLFSIADEIDNPKKEIAINQLEILARRGYFSIPTYEYSQKHDNNGNPIWKCKCKIKEKDRVFEAHSSSKKDAKKTAAFEMLEFVLNEGENEDE